MTKAESIKLRPATAGDAAIIWEILQEAIERRRLDGSKQWQDGYPNIYTINDDIQKGIGYVLVNEDDIIAYAALIFNDEPAYDHIDGAWLTNGDFLVVHRVAVTDKVLGKGIATLFFQEMETFAKSHQVF
jgi:GNAT superfamily N-acetyltransferase